MPKNNNNEDLKQYRKRIIIEATKTLILEIGIEGITIDKILKKIQGTPGSKDGLDQSKNSLGKGTLYEVFKSKEAIIEGVALYIEEMFSRILDDEFKKYKGKQIIQFYIEKCIELHDYYKAYRTASEHILRKILTTRTMPQTLKETDASLQIQLELQSDIRDTLEKAFDDWLSEVEPELLDSVKEEAMFVLGSLIDGSISRNLHRQPNANEILDHLTILLSSNRAIRDTY